MNEQQIALSNLGIAVDEAVARFAGKYELYAKSMLKFATGIVTDGLTPLSEAKEMESEELRRYVHSLKGVTANLSINEAYKLLIEVEQSIKDGATDFDKYAKMVTVLSDIAAKIEAILSDKDAEAKKKEAAPFGSGEECLSLLHQLREHLRSYGIKESEKVVADLLAKKWEGVDTGKVETICRAVEDYEYDKAAEMIDAF